MAASFDRFRGFGRLFDDWWGRPRVRSMPLDAYRRADTFFMHFDVPGVDPDSILVTVEGDALTLKAGRAWAEEGSDELVARERPHGTFERRVYLGADVDREHVEAEYKDGVLTVRLPVKKAAKPHKVPITVIATTEAVEARPAEPSATAA